MNADTQSGVFFQTNHLQADDCDRSSLCFSSDSMFVAKLSPEAGGVRVWAADSGRQALNVQREKESTSILALSSMPHSVLVVASSVDATVWSTTTQSLLYTHGLSSLGGEDPVSIFFMQAESLVGIATDGCVVVLEVLTGRELARYHFAPDSTPCNLLHVGCQLGSIWAVICDRYPDTDGYSLRAIDITNQQTILHIPLDKNDTPFVSPNGRFVVISRQPPNRSEVWDIYAAVRLGEIVLSGRGRGLVFGLSGCYFAEAYDQRISGSRPIFLLDIWNILSLERVCHLNQMLSSDIIWGEHCEFIAVSDHTRFAADRTRNLTIFLNPILPSIRGFTYGHNPYTGQTHRFSPNGRFLASIFTESYPCSATETIPVGTVAITDLHSIPA